MVALEFLFLLTIAGLLVAALARQKLSHKRYPPGPFQWPFFGNVKELRELSKKLGGQHEALLELSRRYDSSIIALKLGNSNTIVVSGIESINAVLSAEEYDGRPWNYFIQLRNLGMKKGLTMNDGDDWREMRSWFLKSMKSIGFSRREMVNSIKEEITIVIDEINEGGVLKMKPIIVPIIMNVLWTFATGKRFEKPKLQYFIDLMERRSQAFDMTGGVLSAYPWIRHIAPEYSGYNLLVTINNEFKAILMETIEEHKKNHVPGSEADLIDMFLNEMYSGKGPQAGFDDDQLVIILLDILLAGLNITASTLDFLFLNMLINQDAQQRLHEEIDRVIGQDKFPDPNDISKLPYVQATIIESQRLVSVVPIIGPRRVLRDTKLLDYDIPKDSVVLMNLHSINADCRLYSEPCSFKPQRFLKNGAILRDDNLLFFGRGKRQCPGVSLAKTSLFLVFTGIMQRYKLLPVPEDKPPSMRIKAGMTMSPEPYDVFLVPKI